MSRPQDAAPHDRPSRPRRRSAPSATPASIALLGPPMAGLTRRGVAFALGGVLVLWVVLIFGRAVATAADAAHQVEAMETANATKAAQLAAGARELVVVQTPAYQDLQARAEGQGTAAERVFSLAPGAPGPAAIAPLGSPTQPLAPSPLQAWVTLLFDH